MTSKSISLIEAEITDSIDQALEADKASGYRRYTPAIRQRLIECSNYFIHGSSPESILLKSSNTFEAPGSVDFLFETDKIPNGMTKKQLQSGLVPILEDYVSGRVKYHGFDQGGGYRNFYLSGPCPIHKRFHDGNAWKWVFKQKLDDTFAGFKCWRDNSFRKIPTVSQLL